MYFLVEIAVMVQVCLFRVPANVKGLIAVAAATAIETRTVAAAAAS